VRLIRKGVEVILPQGMDIKEARPLMIQAQQFDGNRDIRDNANIVVSDEAYETFRKMMEVDCRVIIIEDSYEQAIELKKKFHEFARRNSMNI